MKLAVLALLPMLLAGQALAQNYNWQEMPMGEIHFPTLKSPYGALAPKPENKIMGADLINNHKPITLDLFKTLFYPDGGSEYEIKDKYQAYDRTILNRRFADVLLARILDFKALEAKVEPRVSESRMVYVMRMVLIGNWKFMTKGQTAAVMPKSNEELYKMLKGRVGANPVRFNMNWETCEEGMNYLCESFQKDKFALPKATLAFTNLPDSLIDFQIQIREKLQPMYLKEVRAVTLGSLVKATAGSFIQKAQENPNFAQMKDAYEAVKDPQFKILNFKVNYGEVILTSANQTQAEEVEKWMNVFLQEKLSSSMQMANQIKEADAKKALIQIQRKQIYEALIAGAKLAFPDLKVESRQVAEQFGEEEEVKSDFPHDRNFLAQEYPLLRIKKELALRVVQALDAETVDLGYKTINEVLPDLQLFVQNKYAAAGYRATILKLFETYPLYKTYETCHLDHMPCNEADPTKLLSMMFSEISLNKKNPSKVTDITSMHKALSISMPDFEAVFNMKLNNLKKDF